MSFASASPKRSPGRCRRKKKRSSSSARQKITRLNRKKDSTGKIFVLLSMIGSRTKQTTLHSASNRFAQERNAMISFLRTHGITDIDVLEVMQKLPRELFLE